MISVSGNASERWEEDGIARDDRMLAVNCAGYQKLEKRDLVRERPCGRADYQLIYIAAGRGSFRFEGRPETASAGRLVVYGPGTPQSYRYDAAEGTEAYWVHFTGAGAGELLRSFGLTERAVHAVGVLEEAIALFKKIVRELNLNLPYAPDMAAAYLHELLALLGRRRLGAGDPQLADPYADIHRVMERLHETYPSAVSVAELARSCNLSLYRFIHKFKQATGTSPVQYLTAIRMNEARRLLAETALTVKEIAAIVGYDNPFYFSRVFAAATGMPPSRYPERPR